MGLTPFAQCRSRLRRRRETASAEPRAPRLHLGPRRGIVRRPPATTFRASGLLGRSRDEEGGNRMTAAVRKSRNVAIAAAGVVAIAAFLPWASFLGYSKTGIRGDGLDHADLRRGGLAAPVAQQAGMDRAARARGDRGADRPLRPQRSGQSRRHRALSHVPGGHRLDHRGRHGAGRSSQRDARRRSRPSQPRRQRHRKMARQSPKWGRAPTRAGSAALPDQASVTSTAAAPGVIASVSRRCRSVVRTISFARAKLSSTSGTGLARPPFA